MKDIKYDLYRFTGSTTTISFIKCFIRNRAFRKLVYFRRYNNSCSLTRFFIRILNHFLSNKTSIDLPFSIKIGRGMLMLHPYSIVFNSECVIGENCTIMKGVTIGNSKTGRVGSPVIGNNVYIGLNSSVVGGVSIGNNVLIAANTFVNFDVPDNSLVIGSPGVLHHKENASMPYISNSIFDIEVQLRNVKG